MADSKREEALKALYVALSTIAGPNVTRNASEADDIPPGGLINLSDGDLQAEPVLSPLSYDITHRASVLVLVQVADAAERDSLFDGILVALAGAVDADPSLGGVVDFAACAEPEIMDEPVEGSATIKAATVPVVMEYTAPTALG